MTPTEAEAELRSIWARSTETERMVIAFLARLAVRDPARFREITDTIETDPAALDRLRMALVAGDTRH